MEQITDKLEDLEVSHEQSKVKTDPSGPSGNVCRYSRRGRAFRRGSSCNESHGSTNIVHLIIGNRIAVCEQRIDQENMFV